MNEYVDLFDNLFYWILLKKNGRTQFDHRNIRWFYSVFYIIKTIYDGDFSKKNSLFLNFFSLLIKILIISQTLD